MGVVEAEFCGEGCDLFYVRCLDLGIFADLPPFIRQGGASLLTPPKVTLFVRNGLNHFRLFYESRLLDVHRFFE